MSHTFTPSKSTSTRKTLFSVTAMIAFALASGFCTGVQARGGPVGHVDKTAGPNGGVHASGTRSVNGPAAKSEGTVSGPNGKAASANASSVVTANTASGKAHVETSGGRSADMQGGLARTGNTVSGEGSVQTGAGYGASAKGQVTKSDTGVSGSGSVTTNSGKTASGTVDGNKDTGTVSVTTNQGTKSKSYDNPKY